MQQQELLCKICSILIIVEGKDRKAYISECYGLT